MTIQNTASAYDETGRYRFPSLGGIVVSYEKVLG
jgi:hypothetical protein